MVFPQFYPLIYVPSGIFVISAVIYMYLFVLMCLIVINSSEKLARFSALILLHAINPPGHWQPVYSVIDSVTYCLPHPQAR